MGAVDILRDALFGNPRSVTTKPSREGVLAAFTELEISTDAGIAAAALSGTDLNAAMLLVQPLADTARQAQATLEQALADVSTDVSELIEGAVADATASAQASAQLAEQAAQANLAGSRYFPTIAAGEAGSTTGQLFSTNDGAGNLIYYERTSGGSYEIGRAVTPASLEAALTGGQVSLTADLTLDEYDPRAADSYLLNGYTLTINRMADTERAGIFVGAGTVIIKSGLARPKWWTVQPMRNAARAVSLGGGGKIALQGRYPSEFTQAAPMAFPNVTFEGEKVPTLTAGFAGLTDGTVVEGPFIITAHNVAVTKLGCDAGATVCGSGAAREGLLVINPGQVEGRDPWVGIRIEDVISVCKNATAPVHAVLVENVIGAVVRGVRSVYGETGVAGKMRDSVVDDVLARGHSTVAVLDKSDIYAPSLNNKWSNIRCRPITAGDTAGMRLQAATENSAGHSVTDISADGCTFVISLEPTDDTDPGKRKTLADVCISTAAGDALRFSGIQMGGPCFRISITTYRFNNIADADDGTYGNAIDIRAGVDGVAISTGQSTNTVGDGIRNAGANVIVIGAIAATPGSGRFGFNGVAGSMKVPANSNIGTTNGAVTV